MKKTGARGRAGRSGMLVATAWIVVACGRPAPETGLPTDEASALADRVAAQSGVPDASFVRFQWEYGDRKGRLSGEGVARVTPPDSFRLDLFTAGEGSLAAVLTDDRLRTVGEIEDVELPPPAFLYAMAGVFRPGASLPSDGFRTGEDQWLVYESAGVSSRYRIREGRLMEVEERDGRRTLRRITLEWATDGRWPGRAEYRDQVTPSRVRWELVEARPADQPYPPEIYELGPAR